jgi:hypothetical protein
MLRFYSLGIVLAFTASCAVATTSAGPFASTGANVLTAAEIVASHVSDAYQAVLQLRPDYLRHRYASPVPSVTDSYSVTVYLDGLLLGDAESLRSVPLGEVRSIRYLPPMEADMRFGGQHPAGAILVVTTRS